MGGGPGGGGGNGVPASHLDWLDDLLGGFELGFASPIPPVDAALRDAGGRGGSLL